MSGATANTQESNRLSELRKYRDFLVETHLDISKTSEKIVFTLAGGALGLSLTLIKDLADSAVAQRFIDDVGRAWFLLTLSILLAFLRLLISPLILLKSITATDNAISKILNPASSEQSSWIARCWEALTKPALLKWVDLLFALSSGFALVAGIHGLMQFAQDVISN